METTTEQLKNFFQQGKEYVKNKSQLWKLKTVDKTAGVVSSLVEKIILFFIFIIFFILFNIALALLIGHWLGYSFYGFFVMAGFYGIVGFIVHLSRDKLIKAPITNSIIQKFLN